MDALEARLADAQWLGGQLPSGEDREAHKSLDGVPNPDTHPNTFAWWSLVDRFTDDVKAGWKDSGAAAAGSLQGCFCARPVREAEERSGVESGSLV